MSTVGADLNGTYLSQIIGKLPPLQGEGWGGDGGVCRERTHPHPNCPLASLSPSEGEGTVVQPALEDGEKMLIRAASGVLSLSKCHSGQTCVSALFCLRRRAGCTHRCAPTVRNRTLTSQNHYARLIQPRH
jgi:hypothetical protein